MTDKPENNHLSPSDGGRSNDFFATTHWSAVLKAKQSDTTHAHAALSELCQTYWFPLYAYVRRRGYNLHDAEDLTQGFFSRLLKFNSFADIHRERGKFRSFLIASMKHYLANEWDKASAQKRAVDRAISLDTAKAEHRYLIEPIDKLTPETLFERQWALTLLETVIKRLNQEYEISGHGALFKHLLFAVTGNKNSVPYAKLAKDLRITEEALRVAVHRMRQRYRQVLREEISHTVTDESDVTAEIDYLRVILSR